MKKDELAELMEQAEAFEQSKRVVECADVIALLRDDKHLSFAVIADWMTEHGIECDAMLVYRVYLGLKSESSS